MQISRYSNQCNSDGDAAELALFLTVHIASMDV